MMTSSRRNWTEEEDTILFGIVCSVGESDWPTVSRLFQQNYQASRSSKRTGKQCRERWHNHLNPKINKGSWTDQEEQKLFQVQKTYGNKWKEISFHLPGRTDNDIKNKFYSTLRRSLRRLNKLIGGKNSTGQIREIKPSVLSTIISFIYANEHIPDENLSALKEIPELIFKFSTYKPVRRNMEGGIDDDAREKINIIFQLIDQFNSLCGGNLEEIDQPEEKQKDVKKFWEVQGQYSTPTYERVLEPFITMQPNMLASRSSKFKIQKNLEVKISNYGLVQITNNFFQRKICDMQQVENKISDIGICSLNPNEVIPQRKGTKQYLLKAEK